MTRSWGLPRLYAAGICSIQRPGSSTAPRFFHLPLLLAPDGRRLSKRDRDLDCGILRSRFSPEELLGRLGFLAGLLPVPAPVTLRELLSEFCWDKIPHADILVPEELFQ